MRHLPELFQSESSECGIVCLTMIANYYGDLRDVRSIKKEFPSSTSGTTLRGIGEIAEKLGFMSRSLKLDVDEISDLNLPCILHWDFNHFVVLRSVNKNKVLIHDPNSGLCSLTFKEFSRHFTGVAMEIRPAQAFSHKPAPDSISFVRLVWATTGAKAQLLLVTALSLAVQICILILPLYIQWAIDEGGSLSSPAHLLAMAAAFSLLITSQMLFQAARSWLIAVFTQRFSLEWQGNVVAHLLRLPLGYFSRRQVGDTINRLNSIPASQQVLSSAFFESILDGVFSLAILLLMIYYSAELSLVSIGALIIFVLYKIFSFTPQRLAASRHAVAASRQQSIVFENIRGIQSIKLLGKEQVRAEHYAASLSKYSEAALGVATYTILGSSINYWLFGVERILAVAIALNYFSTSLSVGSLVAYLAYREVFVSRATSFVERIFETRLLRVHGERLADIVLEEPERANQQYKSEEPLDFSVEANGVWFRYSPSDPWIIKDATFTISSGQSVAITGASGCGKSTLAKLLLGFEKPEKGEIRIGGRDINAIPIETLRNLLCAVLQDDVLFSGSILENVAFGDQAVDSARVKKALKLASIDEEFERLPMGVETLISDMGSTLSGGQKQRVLLARALYREPKVLILDEATSHLDVGKERLGNYSVSNLALTRVVIAHRPETIRSCDRELRLEYGVLKEICTSESSVNNFETKNS